MAQAQSRLFTIPRELRDAIYEYTLLSTHTEWQFRFRQPSLWIDYRHRFRSCPRCTSFTRCATHLHHREFSYQPPALLAVNRQTRREASPVFYATTNFLFEEHEHALKWLKALREEDFAYVKKLYHCGCPGGGGAGLAGNEEGEGEGTMWKFLCAGFEAEGIDVSDVLFVCKGGFSEKHEWVGKVEARREASSGE